MYHINKTCQEAQIPFMPLQPKLANAYVPFQYMTNVYAPAEGLKKGTIFPELYQPYDVEPLYKEQ